MSAKPNWTEQGHEDPARLRDADLCNVMDAIPAMVWIASPDGKGTHINRAWTEYLGLSLEDTVGFGWTKTLHPDDIERYLAAWRLSLATGQPLDEEVRYRRAADGQYRWFLSRGIPVRDERGKIVKWFGVGTDIEDRKQAEQAAQRSEQELREVLEQMPAMAFAVLADGTHRYVSDQWKQYTGLSASDTDRQGWARAIHPEDVELHLQKWQAAVATGNPFESEARVRSAKGEYRWFLVRATPLRDKTGNIAKWHGILTDIEGRKQAEEKLRESEFYLAEAQKLSKTGSWAANRDHPGIRYWSEECYRVLGFNPRAALPTYDEFFHRIHPEDQPLFSKVGDKAIAEKTDWELNYRILHPDGQYRDIHVLGHPVLGPTGDLVEFVGTVIDITDRKLVEEALRRSEQELRDLIENMPAMALALLPDGSHLYLTKQWTEYTGLSVVETDYEGWTRMVHPNDVEHHVTHWHSCAEKGQPFENEARFRRVDGSYRWFLVRAIPLRDETGNIVKWYGILTDIEDRKRAEDSLRRSEETLRESQSYLTETQRLTHTGSWANTPKADKVLFWSEEMFRILGLDPALGLPPHEVFWKNILHPDDREDLWQRRQKALCEGSDYSSSFRILMPDGTLRYLDAIAHPVLDNDGQVIKFVGSTVDVTERKLAEKALRRSEAYLAEAQKLTKTGSWAWDPRADQMLYCSDEIYRIFELDPALGIPTVGTFMQRIHPDDRVKVREESIEGVRENAEHAFEYRLLLDDGTIKHVRSLRRTVIDNAGEVVEVVGTTMDITERMLAEQERERLRKLEAELAHMNRVSVMGEMAASLAHEINQPITANVTRATSCLQWLSGDQPNLERARQAVTRILDDAKRAGEIIRRTRSLFKKDVQRREWVNINEVIEEIIHLVRDETTEWQVLICGSLAAELPPVMGDRVQLQQVLMNLIVNSIDAVKTVDGTRKITLTSERDRDHLLISVSDTGPGLPSTSSDIFDAFVTTKTDGTGMGLAISRSIVEAHGGRLWAEANSPTGAVLRFTVPLAAETQR